MNRRGPFAKIVAFALVLAVPLLFVPNTSARASGVLSGTIYSLDERKPLDGAILHAGDMRTGEIHSSAATRSDGSFVLSDLPPSAYELAIEKGNGLYVVGTPVELQPGQRREIQLGLDPDPDDEGGVAEDPETAAENDDDEMGFLDNPLFSSLTVITAAILFGFLVSEIDTKDEGIPSPFSP